MSIEDGSDETLSPTESLDPDILEDLAVDGVMDPPEHWQEADKFGTTHREEAEGESLDQKIAEEVPDVEVEEQPDFPVTVAPDHALSEELVDRIIEDEGPEVIDNIDVRPTRGDDIS